MKEAIDITKSELKWHQENRGAGPSSMHEEGFIKALEHIISLFQEVDASQQAVSPDAQSVAGCAFCSRVDGSHASACPKYKERR